MACPILLAIGLALLLVSELSGVAALRIVAVAVLLTGAIGGGIRSGMAAAPPAVFKSVTARFTRVFARVVAVLLALPVAASLLMVIAGAVHLQTDAAETEPVVIGVAVAVLLLAVLTAALTVALRALRVEAGKSA